MAQISIRVDDSLKMQAEKLFTTLGMNFSTAINVFLHQAVRDNGIPFAITADKDPFYSESNLRALRASVADMEAGRGIIRKTMEELEAMENE